MLLLFVCGAAYFASSAMKKWTSHQIHLEIEAMIEDKRLAAIYETTHKLFRIHFPNTGMYFFATTEHTMSRQVALKFIRNIMDFINLHEYVLRKHLLCKNFIKKSAKRIGLDSYYVQILHTIAF